MTPEKDVDREEEGIHSVDGKALFISFQREASLEKNGSTDSDCYLS